MVTETDDVVTETKELNETDEVVAETDDVKEEEKDHVSNVIQYSQYLKCN